MNIQDMPDDVLVMLFSYFDLSLRAVCELTCQRWRQLMTRVPQPPIRLWVKEDIGSGTQAYEYPPTAFYLGESVQNFEWVNCKVRAEVASSFLKKHNRGSSLFLVANPPELITCLDTIESEWKKLVDLQIECSSSTDDLWKVSRHNLTEYITRLNFFSFFNSVPLANEFFVRCPKLEALSFGDFELPRSHENFRNLPKQLRTLIAVGGSFDDTLTEKLLDGQVSWLQELCIPECNAAQLKKICKTMKNLVTLRFTLEAENAPNIFQLTESFWTEARIFDGQIGDSIEPETELPPGCLWPLVGLTNLRNLSVLCSSTNIEEEFLQVTAKCRHLQSLEVSGPWLSSTFMRSIRTTAPQLKSLALSPGPFYVERTDPNSSFSQAMQSLAELVPMVFLRCLEIASSAPYTEYIVAFIQKSSALRNLKITGAKDESGQHLVLKEMYLKAGKSTSEQFRLCITPQYSTVMQPPVKNLSVY